MGSAHPLAPLKMTKSWGFEGGVIVAMGFGRHNRRMKIRYTTILVFLWALLPGVLSAALPAPMPPVPITAMFILPLRFCPRSSAGAESTAAEARERRANWRRVSGVGVFMGKALRRSAAMGVNHGSTRINTDFHRIPSASSMRFQRGLSPPDSTQTWRSNSAVRGTSLMIWEGSGPTPR